MESEINLISLLRALDEVETVSRDDNATATATATSDGVATTPTLMGVPSEIRLQIFAAVDEGTKTTIRIGETCAYCVDTPSQFGLVALNRTCKQIHCEVKDKYALNVGS